MSGDPTATAAGPWTEQTQLRPALVHFRSADVLPSSSNTHSLSSDTSTTKPLAAVRHSLSHSPSVMFLRQPRSSNRVSQGARVHLTDPQLSRKASKSTLSGSLERLSMSPGPMPHTRQHPYIRPPSRANSRDAGSLPAMPERPRTHPLLDDWASCSSDGLPSLPTSPGWARAEEQAWSLVRHASPSVMSESQEPPAKHDQEPFRSYSFDEYPWSTPALIMPQVRSKTAQALMPTSSLHSDSAVSTMQMIQRLNLESSFEQQPHTPSFFIGSLPVTASPEVSPTEARNGVFESILDARASHDANHTSQKQESMRSSLDMDLSAKDLMESDMNHSDMLCGSSSYMSEREIPSVDLLSVRDRVGPGLYHDGEMIRIAQTRDGLDAHDPSLKPKALEVVRLLGQGSYAVVYLVRELSSPDSSPSPPADTDLSAASTPRGQNQSHPFSSGKTPRQGDRVWFGKEDRPSDQSSTFYALKCLSKRNLTPEQAFTQQNELSIHHSIPSHPNIITLHSAYETTDWLFLVLEYCPGKDLYFWLEEARDEWGMQSSASMQSHASSDVSVQDSVYMEQSTSSTPWLLSTTSPETLLSEPRLQLVSDIFHQMCKAVQFCHDLGISHRDLKPENFIVEDRRGNPDKSDDQVIVKLTDFGLATSENLSCDFNCGSKPYMAFECRHDLSSCYDPKQSDVWSLGVVLLNLIFHRSPFVEASAKHCASFAAFTYQPILFLTQAFNGMTEDMAQFFNDYVFCDVSRQQRRRIAPLAFGQWAQGLPQMLGKQLRLSAHSSLSSISTPLSVSQAQSNGEEHPDKSSFDQPSASTDSVSSSHVRGCHTSGHAFANVPTGGVSSLRDPALESVFSGSMSGSTLSRSSAPFFHAHPE